METLKNIGATVLKGLYTVVDVATLGLVTTAVNGITGYKIPSYDLVINTAIPNFVFPPPKIKFDNDFSDLTTELKKDSADKPVGTTPKQYVDPKDNALTDPGTGSSTNKLGEKQDDPSIVPTKEADTSSSPTKDLTGIDPSPGTVISKEEQDKTQSVKPVDTNQSSGEGTAIFTTGDASEGIPNIKNPYIKDSAEYNAHLNDQGIQTQDNIDQQVKQERDDFFDSQHPDTPVSPTTDDLVKNAEAEREALQFKNAHEEVVQVLKHNGIYNSDEETKLFYSDNQETLGTDNSFNMTKLYMEDPNKFFDKVRTLSSSNDFVETTTSFDGEAEREKFLFNNAQQEVKLVLQNNGILEGSNLQTMTKLYMDSPNKFFDEVRNKALGLTPKK